jgi:D-tyrosyl-tRNA(Tyr) deacylase
VLVFAAISKDDTDKDIESMSGKILKAKLWDDESKDPPGRVSTSTVFHINNTLKSDMRKWKLNVKEIEGEVLCG